jgi:hypothetical protein
MSRRVASKESLFRINRRWSGSIERFQTIVNKSFLDRGRVRRGGFGASTLEFVSFIYKRKNMLLHIFRLETKAPPKRLAKKDRGARPASFAETG